jgi:hypothetical protein
MSRLRCCAISTSASFALVGAASFGGIRPRTYPVIFCIAFWRIGCRPIIWVTWTVRVSGCLIARIALRYRFVRLSAEPKAREMSDE